jgi:hypothetical protein
LPPARHAPEHESGVCFHTDIRTDPEPLHDAGSKAFDQRVGGRDELQKRRFVLRFLQIEGDALLAAAHDVEVHLQERWLRPPNANDFGA